jgi:hypothetical protein
MGGSVEAAVGDVGGRGDISYVRFYNVPIANAARS